MARLIGRPRAVDPPEGPGLGLRFLALQEAGPSVAVAVSRRHGPTLTAKPLARAAGPNPMAPLRAGHRPVRAILGVPIQEAAAAPPYLAVYSQRRCLRARRVGPDLIAMLGAGAGRYRAGRGARELTPLRKAGPGPLRKQTAAASLDPAYVGRPSMSPYIRAR